jgi:hypothetical protein
MKDHKTVCRFLGNKGSMIEWEEQEIYPVMVWVLFATPNY